MDPKSSRATTQNLGRHRTNGQQNILGEWCTEAADNPRILAFLGAMRSAFTIAIVPAGCRETYTEERLNGPRSLGLILLSDERLRLARSGLEIQPVIGLSVGGAGLPRSIRIPLLTNLEQMPS